MNGTNETAKTTKISPLDMGNSSEITLISPNEPPSRQKTIQVANSEAGNNCEEKKITLVLFYLYNSLIYLYVIFGFNSISGISNNYMTGNALDNVLLASSIITYYMIALVFYSFLLGNMAKLIKIKQSIWTLSLILEELKEGSLLKFSFCIASVTATCLQITAYCLCKTRYATEEVCKDVSSPYIFSFTTITTLLGIWSVLTYDAW